MSQSLLFSCLASPRIYIRLGGDHTDSPLRATAVPSHLYQTSPFSHSSIRSQHNINTMILPRANKALQINPPSGDQALSVGGSDWLWAVTAVFVLEFVGLCCSDLCYAPRG